MPTFSQFSADIFFKTQRHLPYRAIIFKTEGSKKFNFWKDFQFALSANYLFKETYSSPVFPYINIGDHTFIKHWLAGNFTMKNESVRATLRTESPSIFLDKSGRRRNLCRHPRQFILSRLQIQISFGPIRPYNESLNKTPVVTVLHSVSLRKLKNFCRNSGLCDKWNLFGWRIVNYM